MGIDHKGRPTMRYHFDDDGIALPGIILAIILVIAIFGFMRYL